MYRLFFNFNELEHIQKKNALTFAHEGEPQALTVRPATQFLQNMENLDDVINQIKKDMNLRVKEFEKKGLLVEAQRLKKRVSYDIRMIRET